MPAFRGLVHKVTELQDLKVKRALSSMFRMNLSQEGGCKQNTGHIKQGKKHPAHEQSVVNLSSTQKFRAQRIKYA